MYFQANSLDVNLTGNKFIDRITKSYGSATVASALANPLFVVKTKLQTYEKRPSITNTVSTLYKEGGCKAFFRGLPATLINNSKLAVQFPLYDTLKDDYGYGPFMASLLSKLSTTSVFYPLDLIRVNQRNTKDLDMMDVTKTIYKQSGVRGFYRGVMLYNMVSTPNFVLMIVFKEMFESYLNDGKKND